MLKCTFDINELHKINISSLQTQEATTRYSGKIPCFSTDTHVYKFFYIYIYIHELFTVHSLVYLLKRIRSSKCKGRISLTFWFLTTDVRIEQPLWERDAIWDLNHCKAADSKNKNHHYHYSSPNNTQLPWTKTSNAA